MFLLCLFISVIMASFSSTWRTSCAKENRKTWNKNTRGQTHTHTHTPAVWVQPLLWSDSLFVAPAAACQLAGHLQLFAALKHTSTHTYKHTLTILWYTCWWGTWFRPQDHKISFLSRHNARLLLEPPYIHPFYVFHSFLVRLLFSDRRSWPDSPAAAHRRRRSPRSRWAFRN